MKEADLDQSPCWAPRKRTQHRQTKVPRVLGAISVTDIAAHPHNNATGRCYYLYCTGDKNEAQGREVIGEVESKFKNSLSDSKFQGSEPRSRESLARLQLVLAKVQ